MHVHLTHNSQKLSESMANRNHEAQKMHQSCDLIHCFISSTSPYHVNVSTSFDVVQVLYNLRRRLQIYS
jgi:hypothetical protein